MNKFLNAMLISIALLCINLALESVELGPQESLVSPWATLHQPLVGMCKGTSENVIAYDGECETAVVLGKTRAVALFPEQPRRQFRKKLAALHITQYGLYLPEKKAAYSLQVYHDLERVGLQGKNLKKILKVFSRRLTQFKSQLGDVVMISDGDRGKIQKKWQPKPTLLENGQYAWDITLEFSKGQRHGQVRQRFILSDHGILIGTVRAVDQEIATSPEMTAFFDSLEMELVSEPDESCTFTLLEMERE